MARPYLILSCALVSSLVVGCVRDYPSTAPYKPPVVANPPSGGLPGQSVAPAQKRLYLDNDKVRIGIDLNAGGAITYLSEAGSTVNMVNNADLGRQLQTAFYAGPFPYSVNGKDPVYQWRNLGWNPVQTGDYFNNPAKIISYQQGPNTLYVKNVPLIWPLFNEPAECVFEHWIELKGNTIHVRARGTVSRNDTMQYESRTQEVPCMYLNGPYNRMVAYTGLKPFTNDAVSDFSEMEGKNRYCSESWIALLNAAGRGVGIYKPDNEVRFSSSGFGNFSSGVGNEFDVTSSYVTAQPHLLIDHNGVYEFEYDLVVGSLNDIRQFAYSQTRAPFVPNYRFTKDRQGWYYKQTRDQGWPIQNELVVRWYPEDPKNHTFFRAVGPTSFYQTAEIPKLYVTAAFQTKGTVARLLWRTPAEDDFIDTPSRYVDFPIIGDGQYRTYEIDMSRSNGWDGAVAQLGLSSPASQFERGAIMRLRSLTTTR